MEKIDIFEVLEDIESSKKYKIIKFNYKVNTNKYKKINFTYKIKKEIKVISFFIAFVKYIMTSSLIFAILLLTTNYSAYFELAKSYFYKNELKKESMSLLNSVEASKISETIKKKKNIKKTQKEKEISSKNTKYNFRKITKITNKNHTHLNIEITPYENRLVIPQIWKNVPIVEVKQKSVNSAKELENIFMKELEDGVVRYPGSTKPGRPGNTFIFGHSSNYPWIKWDYNEVFANLNKLKYWDKVIVYYNQNKYVYKIKEKRVISPWETKILKRNKNKDELTLMTCWPVWTTLNRLIVIWELIQN